jgi:hypothetical protein
VADSLDPPDIKDPPCRLSIEPNPAAPVALQEIGIAYWDLAGIDPETGNLVWAHRTSDLRFKAWSGTAYHAAAAAVTATVAGYACAACEGELTLVSRQALADARSGKAVKCRACNKLADEYAAAVLNPRSLDKRARQSAEAEAARELDQAQREAIAARYPVESASAEAVIVGASLLAAIGALAVLHAAGDNGGLIYPVSLDGNTIGPNYSLSRDLFIAAWHGGLLRIHPSSPAEAFTWESGAALGGSIHPGQVRFYVAGDGTFSQRLEDFADALRGRLSPSGMASAERAELAGLARRIISEEAGRYFAHKLREHRLPDPAETHEEALRTATTRGASLFAIGHLYRMAWSSARDASSAHQRNAGMPRESAVKHGLNQFERWIQRASDDPRTLGVPFNEDTNALPLSAVTGVVFRTIMGLNPISASPDEIAGVLQNPPGADTETACGALQKAVLAAMNEAREIEDASPEWDEWYAEDCRTRSLTQQVTESPHDKMRRAFLAGWNAALAAPAEGGDGLDLP